MKAYNTLIKLKKKELDELRSEAGKLEARKTKLDDSIINMKRSLEKEKEFASQNEAVTYAFSNYMQNSIMAQELVGLEIKKLDQEIERYKEVILDAFIELKRFEIAKENKLKRIQANEKRKEDIVMDEIGMNNFLRKQ